MKFIKKLILSLFDEIHVKEECTTSKMWITDTNLHHLIKISLQGLQKESYETRESKEMLDKTYKK
jgi:hypothetical protein